MTAAKQYDPEFELKRAHVDLLKHAETCHYAGIIMLGESSVEYDAVKCPTAYTDGVNKRYGAKFLQCLTRQQVAGLVLHENFHVMLKHIPRHRDLIKRDSMLANIAMDYVVNDMIHEIRDKSVVQLPPEALYDPKFKGWSVRQVYEYLEQEEQQKPKPKPGQGQPGQGQGQGQPRTGRDRGQPLDEHDPSGVDQMTPEQAKKLDDDVQEAIHQGGLLAGRFGNKLPRQITELMQPEINWQDVLRDFWTSAMRGHDEYTYSRLNRRRLADDLYLPTMYSEKVGRVVLGIDTSGSIGPAQLNQVASEVVRLCEVAPPDEIVVLWWDTEVRGKQVFTEGSYAGIASMLKPAGGGGTLAGCVSAYMAEQNLSADCVIMFTDGYVENDVRWQLQAPTLWLVDRNGNTNFQPPAGTQKVKVNN